MQLRFATLLAVSAVAAANSTALCTFESDASDGTDPEDCAWPWEYYAIAMLCNLMLLWILRGLRIR